MNTRFTRRSLIAALPQQALACDETSTFERNVNAQGVGIQGHDPVAWFSASHRGATCWFASVANRDAFKANANWPEPPRIHHGART